ncbi:MAG: SAM-dependent methyltransferase [Lachnospiraceae bacterium]|nr:SAM-dependent methyltransferase [Lachnospiraceae bacterium]
MEQNKITELQNLLTSSLTELTISNPVKEETLTKVKIRPLELKGTSLFQIEEFTKTQAFHKNVTLDELQKLFPLYFEKRFRQALLKTPEEEVQILVSKKGAVSVLRKKTKNAQLPKLPLSHNRTKNYILNEGTPVPFLVELGVMTKDGAVTKAKYDKFRQINRFLEFIQDILPALPANRTITILDFGCGKSYLTFAIYHFLKVLHGRNVKIIGLDLKKDVITNCNRLAEKLGYEELTFLHGDIADYEGMNQVDMVVTLHACDTATDYALAKATFWNASVILSVPCCQHELNKQIANENLAPLLKYGLIKERTAALFTDAIRGNLLEAAGYQTQILEFIDMEHTPKNILLRAVRKQKPSEETLQKNLAELKPTLNFLHVDPKLYHLLIKIRKQPSK